MRSLMSFLLLAAVVVAAGTFWACNDRLDDPTLSEGLLSIESVDPPIVEADLDAVDPNGTPQQLSDDEVTIIIKNRPRRDDAGDFADVFVKKYQRVCVDGATGTARAASTNPTGFTIPIGSSASVPITAVTVAEKTTGAADGDTWVCSIQFFGEDVAGNPAKSEVGGFSISLANR